MRCPAMYFCKSIIRTAGILLTLAALPVGLHAAHGDIQLDWDANSEPDLSHYNVYRAQQANGPYTKINTTPVVEAWYVDPGLTPGETYYYVVTAVDEAGNESTYSNEAASQPADLEPPVFSNVTVAPDLATFGTEVTVTFTVSELLAEAPQVLINDHMATPANQDGLSYAFTYVVGEADADGPARIDLSATDHAGNTGEWSDATLLTVDQTSPEIMDLAVSPDRVRAGDDIVITFLVSETPATTPTVTINGRGATAYSVTDNAYTYYYTIQNNDAEGPATVSVSLSDRAGNIASASPSNLLVIDLTAPPKPEDVTVAVSDSALTVSWSAVNATDLAGYRVLMATEPGGAFQPVGDGALINATTLTIPDLQNGVTYTFIVTAEDTVGNVSPSSDAVSATPLDLTPPAPPSNLRATPLANS